MYTVSEDSKASSNTFQTFNNTRKIQYMLLTAKEIYWFEHKNDLNPKKKQNE